MKNPTKLLVFMTLAIMMLSLSVAPVKAEDTLVEVLTDVRLLNVEKVDLDANSYKLDFYIWFSWDPTQITLSQIKDFEFLNGALFSPIVNFNRPQFII